MVWEVAHLSPGRNRSRTSGSALSSGRRALGGGRSRGDLAGHPHAVAYRLPGCSSLDDLQRRDGGRGRSRRTAPAEATSRRESLGTRYGRSPLVPRAGDQRFPTTPDAVGFDLDGASAADAAWEVGRHWWLRQRTQIGMIGLRGGISASPKVRVAGGRLEQQLVGSSGEVDRDPVDARVDRSSGSAVLEQDVSGKELDVAGSRSRVLSTMSRLAAGLVPLVTTTTNPSITRPRRRDSGLSTALVNGIAVRRGTGSRSRCDHRRPHHRYLPSHQGGADGGGG